MNKRELIDAVAEHTGCTKAEVTRVLDGFLDVVPMAVAAGDKVAIPGFGSFEAAYRPARSARNLHTGERIEVAASWSPKFKAGSAFKGLVGASESLKSLAAA